MHTKQLERYEHMECALYAAIRYVKMRIIVASRHIEAILFGSIDKSIYRFG